MVKLPLLHLSLHLERVRPPLLQYRLLLLQFRPPLLLQIQRPLLDF
jgi:hypothetical protein